MWLVADMDGASSGGVSDDSGHGGGEMLLTGVDKPTVSDILFILTNECVTAFMKQWNVCFDCDLDTIDEEVVWGIIDYVTILLDNRPELCSFECEPIKHFNRQFESGDITSSGVMSKLDLNSGFSNSGIGCGLYYYMQSLRNSLRFGIENNAFFKLLRFASEDEIDTRTSFDGHEIGRYTKVVLEKTKIHEFVVKAFYAYKFYKLHYVYEHRNNYEHRDAPKYDVFFRFLFTKLLQPKNIIFMELHQQNVDTVQPTIPLITRLKPDCDEMKNLKKLEEAASDYKRVCRLLQVSKTIASMIRQYSQPSIFHQLSDEPLTEDTNMASAADSLALFDQMLTIIDKNKRIL